MPLEAIVNADILLWARLKSTLSVDEAAKKATVKPEGLGSWERGEGYPTMPQLRKLARVYKRSVALFYLPEPPQSSRPLRDLRRLPGEDAPTESAQLAFDIRRVVERRVAALDLLRELDEDAPQVSLEISTSDDPEAAGEQIRSFLGVSLLDQSAWRDEYEALNAWRSALENHGVLVFQATETPVSEMRGFSVPEFPFPVIAVNAKDRPKGRIFTLHHEFAHILLRQGGLCDLHESDGLPSEDERLEVFCNAVAAGTLVPLNSLVTRDTERIAKIGDDRADAEIASAARRYWVSREVIVRRLLTARIVSREFYLHKRDQYAKEYERNQEEAKRKEKPGFQPYYRKVIGRSGRLFTRLVLETYDGERITAHDVSTYLGMKLAHLPRIREAMRSGSDAFENVL